MKQSKDQQLAMWNATNYGAQTAHLQEAGLNPALMYGAGGSGGSTTAGSGAGRQATASGAGKQQLLHDRTTPIDIAQITVAAAQAKKLEAEADNLDQDTKEKEKQMKQSKEQQLSMWNATNYEAQTAHLEAAGLNPALMYGAGGGGGSTTAGSGAGGQASASGAGKQQLLHDRTTPIDIAQITVAAAQAKKLEAEADNLQAGSKIVDSLIEQGAKSLDEALWGDYYRDKEVEQSQRLLDQQTEAQSKLMKQNKEQQLAMWNETNYGAQVSHLEAAGLNPALMYGAGGGGGSTTTSIDVTTTSADERAKERSRNQSTQYPSRCTQGRSR